MGNALCNKFSKKPRRGGGNRVALPSSLSFLFLTFCPIAIRADATLCATPSHSRNSICSSMISGSDNNARCCFNTCSARRAAAALACLRSNPPAPNFFSSSSSSSDIFPVPAASSIALSMDANNTDVAEESAVSSASLRRRALRKKFNIKIRGVWEGGLGGGLLR